MGSQEDTGAALSGGLKLRVLVETEGPLANLAGWCVSGQVLTSVLGSEHGSELHQRVSW